MTKEEPKGLLILWVTQDKEAAQRMVFMYARNSNVQGWWAKVRLVVWGPSAHLLATDEELQQGIEELRSAGVDVQACKACSDSYGVSDRLAELGVIVRYWGKPLTDHLKEGWAVLSV